MIMVDLMIIFKIICLIMLFIEGIVLAIIGIKNKDVKKSGLITVFIFTILPFIYIFIKE